MKKFSIFLTAAIVASQGFAASLDYEVSATKLDKSRNNLSPKTGGSAYSFSQKDIDNLPQGQATSLNQVLLRAPGVTQDSYGALHVRNDHSNLQYRINDVIIPEGIGGFGQVLDVRFAESVELLTGALPAQYGYRTAGIVDIKTKKGSLKNGGYSEIITGSNQTFGANQQVTGSKDRLNYFISASYLQNSRGLETPSAAKKAQHDETAQDKLFGYFSYLLDEKKRLSLIVANATNRFQIPNSPNQAAAFTYTGQSLDSSQINEKQKESNRYAILSLQGVSDAEIDYQISAFARQNEMTFRGDDVGDLIYNGVASDIDRTSFVSGVQSDFSKELNEKNILRFGLYFSDSAVKNKQSNAVFETSGGTQTGFTPFRIDDETSKHTRLYSIYAQNEFKPTKKLTLNFGLRGDMVQGYVNEQQLSPRLGAIYAATPQTKLHAGFARYFTPPKPELVSSTDISRFQNTSNEAANLVNDKVRAERSSYYDAGISHEFSKNFNVGLDGYFKDIKNLLDEGQFGNALIYKPFNYAEAKVFGVELSADYKKENFAAFANLAWQKAKARKIISSQYLFDADELDFIANNYVNPDHSQKWTGSAGASYMIAQTHFGGDVLFGSGLRKGFANTQHLPFYSQFNIFASREISKINFRLTINNIFDREYKLRDGSGIGVGAAQFAPRRAYYLIISKQF